MGVASLTLFDFATLRFHFAIFTIVFVIDQINEASPDGGGRNRYYLDDVTFIHERINLS